jgi:acetyl esterase/lipase
MELSRVDEELRGSVNPKFDLPSDRRWARAVTRSLIRLAPKGDVSRVTISQTMKSAPSVRMYRPDAQASSAALFWIHGGGMIIGRASMDDRLCAATARELGIVVVSAEYRLAPEHPFPEPLYDCHWGWLWLQQSAASLRVDPGRVAVGGQSAGGGLAAGLVQLLADSEGPSPVAQWLFSPMLDDRTAADRHLDGADHFVWNNAKNRFGWRSYLNAEPGSPDISPYASPARRENLEGLPRTWIGVGDIDLFYDEDVAYANALSAAGVDVTTEIVPGAPHGFEAVKPNAQISRTYVANAQQWLREAVI